MNELHLKYQSDTGNKPLILKGYDKIYYHEDYVKWLESKLNDL